MAADDLATQAARALASMILTLLIQIFWFRHQYCYYLCINLFWRSQKCFYILFELLIFIICWLLKFFLMLDKNLPFPYLTQSVTWLLTHWGPWMHICISKPTIIGPDNGLKPDWCQAIIWTNAGILSIRTLGTNFSEILSKIHTFLFNKMQNFENGVCEMASILSRPAWLQALY